MGSLLTILTTGGQAPDLTPTGPVRQVLGSVEHASTNWTTSTSAQRAGMSSRTTHLVSALLVNPAIRWKINGLGAGVNSTSTATMRAAIIQPSGSPLGLTFNGAQTVTIPQAGEVLADPASITFRKGDKLILHVWISVDVTDGVSPATSLMILNGYDFGSSVGTWDQTIAAPADTGGIYNTLRPVGVFAPSPANSWIMTGDSIGNTNNSLLDRVAYALKWASSKIAVGGEGFKDFPTRFSTRYGTLLQYFSHVLCQYGVNDSGTTTATIQANAIAYWNSLKGAGPQVIYQTTMTPTSSSTDNWATVANQTAVNGANRAPWNQWLRDGAPMVSGAAVAAGTGGALRAGQAGHPLTGVLDVASVVESSQDSGKWLAGIGGDGTHPTAEAHRLMGEYLAAQMASI